MGVNNVQYFFDYWAGSLPSIVRTGKLIAWWRHPKGQGIHGDNPPTLKDVCTGGYPAFKFSRMMLGRHKYLSKDVRDFIVANMLRHWTEIELLIQSEPYWKFFGDEKVFILLFQKLKCIALL